MLRAILISLMVLIAAPTTSHAYGIADSFTYNKAPTSHTHYRKTVTRKLEKQRLYRQHSRVRTIHHNDGRPRAWCGWWARQQKGVSSPSYNRAINWLNYGRPTSPQVGAVVVWSHHVGIITGRDSRGWLVTSGNWNNRVATVPLSQMGRGVQGYRI